MIQKVFFSRNLMEYSCRTYIGQDSFIIHSFISIQRSAVAFALRYKCIKIVLLTLPENVQVFPVVRHVFVQCSRRKTPCAAHGIILDACACVFRERERILMIRIQLCIHFTDHRFNKRDPVIMHRIICFFLRKIRFDNIIYSLSVQIRAVAAAVHPVVPPAVN